METSAAVDQNASVGRVASVNRASVEHCITGSKNLVSSYQGLNNYFCYIHKAECT